MSSAAETARSKIAASNFMPKFMFWNTAKKPQASRLRAAADAHDIDMFLLAEFDGDSRSVVLALNENRPGGSYWEDARGVGSLKIFTRLPTEAIVPLFDDGRVTFREIRPPLGRSLLLAGAHLVSKLETDPDTQYLGARQFRAQIEDVELRLGHERTMVIGDLNMNPFDVGMLACDGLHALPDKRIVEKNQRTVRGQAHRYFYNPMWSRLGDESVGPPGTYFYNNSGKVINLFWNSFDHVLLRSALLPFYDRSSVEVLTSLGGESLLRDDRIDKSISDHLPIIANLATERSVYDDKSLENPGY